MPPGQRAVFSCLQFDAEKIQKTGIYAHKHGGEAFPKQRIEKLSEKCQATIDLLYKIRYHVICGRLLILYRQETEMASRTGNTTEKEIRL